MSPFDTLTAIQCQTYYSVMIYDASLFTVAPDCWQASKRLPGAVSSRVARHGPRPMPHCVVCLTVSSVVYVFTHHMYHCEPQAKFGGFVSPLKGVDSKRDSEREGCKVKTHTNPTHVALRPESETGNVPATLRTSAALADASAAFSPGVFGRCGDLRGAVRSGGFDGRDSEWPRH